MRQAVSVSLSRVSSGSHSQKINGSLPLQSVGHRCQVLQGVGSTRCNCNVWVLKLQSFTCYEQLHRSDSEMDCNTRKSNQSHCHQIDLERQNTRRGGGSLNRAE